MSQRTAHVLDNDVSDYTLHSVASIRGTRAQVNENTKRLAALEQQNSDLETRLTRLEGKL